MYNVAFINVAQHTDELQALTDAYHAVMVALDSHRTSLSVVDYVQARQTADRIASGVSDYAEAISELNALAAQIEGK